MNQHLEAEEVEQEVASLVLAVATESNEPIAWCRFGVWSTASAGRSRSSIELASRRARICTATRRWRSDLIDIDIDIVIDPRVVNVASRGTYWANEPMAQRMS